MAAVVAVVHLLQLLAVAKLLQLQLLLQLLVVAVDQKKSSATAIQLQPLLLTADATAKAVSKKEF